VSAPVRVCVITGFGINADEELALAFNLAGGRAERVHVNDLVDAPRRLAACRIIAFPGGFSFGDHLGSGKVFATLVRKRLRPVMEEFVSGGGLVIGICNGFQILVKMGILPNLSGTWNQEVSLVHNDSGKFEDRWVRVTADPASPCLWTRGLGSVDLPVRHGEGKFVAGAPGILAEIRSRGLAALRYCSRDGGAPGYPENPNGSVDDIAGISDRTGRVFGLMPHPEAFLFPENHPEWSRGAVCGAGGLAFFRAGLAAARSS
jgi:phosphoribosylformylglycinamidine synthase